MSKAKPKNILGFFRHGKKLSTLGDPPLSQDGHSQAKKLVELVGSDLPVPVELWSSPRLRARQTFTPLVLALNIPILTRAALEDRSNESAQEFQTNLKKLLQEALQNSVKNGPLYLVSHYDWLEVAMLTLDAVDTAAEEPFHPGEYRLLTVSASFLSAASCSH